MKKLLKVISLLIALMIFIPTVTDSKAIFQYSYVNAEETETTIDEGTSFTEDKTGKTEAATEEDAEDFVEPEYESNFTFPEELRGITITPSVDFANTEDKSETTINVQLEEIMQQVSAKGLNTVIINTSYCGSGFYNTDINDSVSKTPVELAIDAAKEKGYFVYLIFDINYVLGQQQNSSLQDRIDYLALIAHTFTVKHRVDGVILNGYYSSKNKTSFNDYMENGSGIGFDNWLIDNGSYVFSLVSDAIRKTNNTIPVGIYLHDVWANYTTNAEGSNTNDPYEALKDGYSDTLSYIKSGYADFMMIEAEGSLNDTNIPFGEFVGWWGKYAKETDIPLFVMHDNSKLCTNEEGWVYPDQIVKQLRDAKSVQNYKGSAFNSYSSLIEDKEGSTNALMMYYNETLNMETLDNELTIVSPKSTTFTTEEPTVAFMGTFDPNFTVYFNGQVIELNNAGNFYYEEELDIGLNTFTIKNKGKTITYNITRKVQVLKSIEPASNIEVEGQSSISITAIAYKGSYVTASINGKKVVLQEQEGIIEGYENSNYVRYIGAYTVPKGIINKAQNLGNVVIYGTYSGKNGKNFNESIKGGQVIISALPEVPNNADGSLLRVRNNNTMVYDYRTTNSTPTPNQARLPAGVLDYCVKKVTYSGISYYLTLSGKRIKCTDVDVLDNQPIGLNHITPVSATVEGGNTILRIKQDVKVPFSMVFSNIMFSSGSEGNYNVCGFNPGSITFTFDYANGATGNFSMPSGGIFSGCNFGQTTSDNVTKTTMTLTFTNSQRFAGVTAYYEDGNTLVLKFNNKNTSLSGTVVVIDPGHGMTSSGKIDPGAVGHITEQSALPPITKYLQQELTSRGATVYRLNTESQYYDTEQRAELARQYNPDIFISIHCNKVVGKPEVKGTEAWYFTPWSQPLAASVSSSVSSYFSRNVYGGASYNRGAKYNYFWVTLQQDFASILLETGFVSNYDDAMALSNPSHQQGIANAIADGIQNYLAM